MAKISLKESFNLGATNRSLNEQKQTYDDAVRASTTAPTNNPFGNPSRDNYQTYPYDYFSGTDCKVYFGDIWVDDIITVQYSVSQSKTPIYGYASQYYQGIAMGQVLVNGVLTVAFKETGYLNIITALLEKQRTRQEVSLQQKASIIREKFEDGTTNVPYIPGATSINGSASRSTSINYNPNGSPDIIRNQETIESILMNKKGLTASGFVLDYLSQNDGKDFEDIAELLEDTIWGDSNGTPYSQETMATLPRLKRADEFDYKYSDKEGNVSVNSDYPIGIRTPGRDHDYSDCLNILLTFGDINDFRAEHTLVSLNDVHFTGQSVMYAPDGNPIAEQYSFFCREINRNLGTKTFNINELKLNIGNDAVTLSKYEDVEKLGEYLTRESTLSAYEITTVSKFNGTWESYTDFKAQSYVIRRNELPFIDQLISDVEQLINNPISSNVDPRMQKGSTNISLPTENSQYVFQITFKNQSNPSGPSNVSGPPSPFVGGPIGQPTDVSQKVIIVMGQSIPNTYTYKCLSPTRTNFSSFGTVSREDLWTASASPVNKNEDDPSLSSASNNRPNEVDINNAKKTNASSTETPINTDSTDAFLADSSAKRKEANSDAFAPDATNVVSDRKSDFYKSINTKGLEVLNADQKKIATRYMFEQGMTTEESVRETLKLANPTTNTYIPNSKEQYDKTLKSIETSYGKPVAPYIESGLRSFEKQTYLRELALSDGNPAANPGNSIHERGLAFDALPKLYNDPVFIAAASRAGFTRPYLNTANPEPWHFEKTKEDITDKTKFYKETYRSITQ
jgi:LAS superfamily LD-carboxypeptidase LdcB